MSRRTSRPDSVNPLDYLVEEPPTWKPPRWLADFACEKVWPFIDAHQEAVKAALHRWLALHAQKDERLQQLIGLENEEPRLASLPGTEAAQREVAAQIDERIKSLTSANNEAPLDLPLPPPDDRTLDRDACLVALLALNDETRNPKQRVGPSSSRLFSTLCFRVRELQKEHLPALQAILKKARRSPPRTGDIPKGRPGRRGYPLKALDYAKELRRKHPNMKAEQLRALCLKKFPKDDLPPDGESFRRWLNRKRANRAN